MVVVSIIIISIIIIINIWTIFYWILELPMGREGTFYILEATVFRANRDLVPWEHFLNFSINWIVQSINKKKKKKKKRNSILASSFIPRLNFLRE